MASLFFCYPRFIMKLVTLVPLATAALILGCGSSSSSSTGTTTDGTGDVSTGTGSGSTTASSSTGSGGSGGTGGGSSTSGTGGGGVGGDTATGPINSPADKWTYVPFSGTQCMDGSEAAIGVNNHASADDVVIYLEGGNACFGDFSCGATANAKGYPETSFDKDVTGALASMPIFDRSNSANPLKGYNYVFVPYCTGDVHAGNNDVTVGGAMRHFHGFGNMTAFLKRIVATYPNAKHVLLTGSSAGGFGAALNYDQTVKAFGSGVEVNLLDDSGPPMANTYVPACLQKAFVDTWGLASTAPAGCPNGCVQADGTFMEPLFSYLTSTYSAQHIGLISSTSDATISTFWGYGDDNCSAGFDAFPTAYPAGQFEAGLRDIRDRIAKSDAHFSTFYIDSTVTATIDGNAADTHHTWLTDSAAYGVSVGSTSLSTWLAAFVAGSNPANVGSPAP